MHAPMFRVWRESSLYESWVMFPVQTLTSECNHKEGARTFVETRPEPRLGMQHSFRVDHPQRQDGTILMQNSNVRDRAGQFIFDGDILQSGTDEDPGERALCYYDKGTFSFSYWSQVVKDNAIVAGQWWGEGWEPYIGRRVTATGRVRGLKIIGNVCENPELLGIPRELVLRSKHIYEIQKEL